jgi:Kef-type K+ transport system membrane component KefB
MNKLLNIGVLIFTGYLFGELAEKIKLPTISGYILGGILQGPDLLGIMSYATPIPCFLFPYPSLLFQYQVRCLLKN